MTSNGKAFFFCGIIELLPDRRSGKPINPNSALDHNSRSVARRVRVTPKIVAADSNLSTKSLDATASRECSTGSSKPSSSAVREGRMAAWSRPAHRHRVGKPHPVNGGSEPVDVTDHGAGDAA